MIDKPAISPDFTIEDIHKIRVYHYEITKNMSAGERHAYYRKRADEAQFRVEQMRKADKTKAI